MNSYKKARKEANLTQAELSAKIHVSQGSISQWETGSTCPDIKTLIQLANLYGISLDSLVGREHPEDVQQKKPAEISGQRERLLNLLTSVPEDQAQEVADLVAAFLSVRKRE